MYDHLVVDIVTFVVLALAVARITRAIVWDKISIPARNAVLHKFGATHPITYLVHCIWCTGFWIAPLVVAPYLIWPHNPWLTGIYLSLAIAELAPRLLSIPQSLHAGSD